MQTEFNFEIDLKEGLKNETKAKVVIKKVQDAIDELVIANQGYKKGAEDLLKISAEYEKQVEIISNANLDLMDALKNIHIFLGSKKDLFKGDAEFNDFMNKLSTWTISSSAIKASVIQHKRKENVTAQ